MSPNVFSRMIQEFLNLSLREPVFMSSIYIHMTTQKMFRNTMRQFTQTRKTKKKQKGKDVSHVSQQIGGNKYKAIVNRLNPIDKSKIVSQYKKLKDLRCKGAINASSHIRLGNEIVDYFTLVERLHTKGNQNISFYQFWGKRDKYRKVPYIKKMLDFYKTRRIDEIRKFKYIYNLYFSSITIFKPVVAMETYCRVKANRVLDFTMGWGGRLVGACALDLEAYIGIDINKNLKDPYKKMEAFLREQGTKIEIDIRFQDALQVDYQKLDYDTVMTSPPYYDLEKYRSSKKIPETKEKWMETFYKPLYEKTWDGLKKGGHYCLNIPQEIYEHTCIPVLGKSHMQFLLKKKDRSEESQYKEYIYVWRK